MVAKSPDRVRQVETTKKEHGQDHYRKIGKKGGDNSPTKFNSDTGRRAVLIRWERYRAEKLKKANEQKEGK